MGKVATPARPETPVQLAGLGTIFGRFGGLSTFGPLLALLIAIAIFGVLSSRFLRADNLTVIVEQVMVVGTLAVGQTLVILTGGIDLSNGAIMVFTSILMAKLAVGQGLAVPIAILVGLLAAGCLGAANGLLVTRFRLPPFIVTLGMLNIVLSITLLYSGGSSVTRLPEGLLILGRRLDLGGTMVTFGSLLMLVLFGIAAYVLKQTAWGTHVYAIGNNVEAARLSGIRVNLHLLMVYALGGLIYGVAGVMLLGRVTVADPLGGQTSNLDSITAVVIGGTSLFGGRGSVLNTLIGALVVGVLRNGLTLVGIDALYQTLATGVLVIVAVAVDQFARRGTG
jgi:fructose transport system permease protein